MDVTMPQLGETVTEGTITRWLKQVGDHVDADEPLFEVSTDKVDSEVPAPAAGVVTEILVPEGETVEVGTRLAVVGDAAGAPAPRGCRTGRGGAAQPEPAPEPRARARSPSRHPSPTPAPAAAAPEPAPGAAASVAPDARRRARSPPPSRARAADADVPRRRR